jgi:hypothetical protein
LWPFSETTAAAMRVSDAAQPSIAVAAHYSIASHAGAIGAVDRPNDARPRINCIGDKDVW